MKRKLVLTLLLLALALPAAAQFTLVSGQITDPNGLLYAYGTISPTLVSSSSPTLGGLPYTPPVGAVNLDSTGKFTMQLANQASLSPGGTTWNFHVCSGAGTVPPAFGKGPLCFDVTGVVIAGATQSLSATLSAAAPALTVTFTAACATCVVTNPSGDQTITSSTTQALKFLSGVTNSYISITPKDPTFAVPMIALDSEGNGDTSVNFLHSGTSDYALYHHGGANIFGIAHDLSAPTPCSPVIEPPASMQ